MKSLADVHAPATLNLAEELRDALRKSIRAAGLDPRYVHRGCLIRVSDENRAKFERNLDADLDWLTWSDEAAWVKANVTDVDAFRVGPVGDSARTRVGMHPLWAPGGGQRLIGGWLVRGGWIFVFLLTSAAKPDLPRGANAATEVIKAMLLALATEDPHAGDQRSLLFAHALDRLLRGEKFAWEVYDTLTQTYVLVDAAGRRFDALDNKAKDEWTLVSFGASRGRDDTARRFLVSRLNKARAGNWPGNENSLPIGFCASAEPDAAGRMNLEPAGEQRRVSRPVPDPRQRWAVQTIATVFADPAIQTWTAAATECGRRGITASGADEVGTSLAELSDKTSAGRLLLSVRKVRAYATGLLSHTETGVTPGQFTPGDGHQLHPRFPGDALGTVTYDIRVGLPEEHGWDWGVTAEQWAQLLRKFWLPGYEPAAFSWADPPEKWDWAEILEVSERRPRRRPTGRHAANPVQRPFSGLMRWTAGPERHLLYCRSAAGQIDRYEWRAEKLQQARTNPKCGQPYEMRSSDGDVVSSWPVAEFHRVWCSLALDLLLDLLPDGLEQHRLTAPTATDPQAASGAALIEHDAAVRGTRAKAAEHREDAESLRLMAARELRKGNEAGADTYDRQAAGKEASAEAEDSRADDLAANPPTATSSAPRADFGTPAAVIGALTGAFASGAAPVALQDALRELGATSTRLAVVDEVTAEMELTLELRTSAGQSLSRTGRARLRRSRPGAGHPNQAGWRERSRADAARAWFRDAVSLPELLEITSAPSEVVALRLVREYLAVGGAREIGQPAMDCLAAQRIPAKPMRAAVAAHPIGLVRQVMWHELEGGPAPDTTGAFSKLIVETYRSPEHDSWGRKGALLDPTTDHRLDALTVLRHLPDPTQAIPASHLAELAGVDVRSINTVSSAQARGVPIPATLDRVGAWARIDARLATERNVALPRCPWTDCESTVADALVLLPELVYGCGTTVVCRHCLRPPTKNVQLPDDYESVFDPAQTRTGTWVQCAAGCGRDFGAGPGTAWRWDDAPASDSTWHPGCRPDRTTNADIRAWAMSSGLQVSDRGRIRHEIVAAYEAATDIRIGR